MKVARIQCTVDSSSAPLSSRPSFWPRSTSRHSTSTPPLSFRPRDFLENLAVAGICVTSRQKTDNRCQKAPRHLPPKNQPIPEASIVKLSGVSVSRKQYTDNRSQKAIVFVSNGVQLDGHFLFSCKRNHFHAVHHLGLLYIFLACGLKNYGVGCKGYFFRVAKSATDSGQTVLRTGLE